MRIIDTASADYEEFVSKLDRRALPDHSTREIVAGIIDHVGKCGDQALREYAQKFDGVDSQALASLKVSDDEILEAKQNAPESLKEAVAATLSNIEAFAKKSHRQDWKIQNNQGVEVGERFRPFSRVGVYVPGGKAPLVSTSMMTAGFAQAAGVKEIVACTPCGKDGKVNSDLLYALVASGATEIYKVGGAQAIAAMALGTESILPVEKIVGPGNRFVVEAKRQLVGAVSIDLLPGPSEVLILADQSATPAYVAADMLAQAEHGGDSVAGLITDSKEFALAVEKEIQIQLESLTRKEIIEHVLNQGAWMLVVSSIDQGIEFANKFAPEHIVVITENEDKVVDAILTAGAIYAGDKSAVAIGDFLAGPSHTLPTGGAGKSFSGLRPDQFQRRTSIVRADAESVKKSVAYVEEFSRVEGLDAHGKSVRIRC